MFGVWASVRDMRAKRKVIFAIITGLLFLVFVLLVVEVTHLQGYTRYAPVKTIRTHLNTVFGEVPPNLGSVQLSARIDEETAFARLAQEQVNLAGYFWYDQVRKQGRTLRFNETCAQIPDLWSLHFVNMHWQVLTLPESSLQLYAAYLDNRDANPLGPVVRILGMVALETQNGEDLVFPDLHCQVWSKHSEQPVLTQVFAQDYLWREYWGKAEKGKYHPYMLTCILPENQFEEHLPEAVSIVHKPCDTATNLLKVTYEHDKSRRTSEPSAGPSPSPRICACVKGVSEIEDKSLQLVEWLEWLKLVGLEHVYISLYHVPEPMKHVLDYYSQAGFLSYSQMSLSGYDPNTPFLQYFFHRTPGYSMQFDLISYNDCLLRNMYNYDYVIPLELDEIIMPTTGNSILTILKEAPADLDSYAFKRMPYVRELVGANQESFPIPKFLTFLQSVYRLRASKDKPMSIRCLFNTRTMLTIHNHYPFVALHDRISSHDIELATGFVEQHLEWCPESTPQECRQRQEFDARKWDFKNEIVLNVGRVLKNLRLL